MSRFVSPAMRRGIALALIVVQALFGVPISTGFATRASATPNSAALPEPVVEVNRTVPRVTPPSSVPSFSRRPSTAEFFQSRILDFPLVPLGGEPAMDENRALAGHLMAFYEAGARDWKPTVGRFLADYPASPWRAALLVNIGALEARRHAYSSALEAWDAAWALTKDATDVHGRAVADQAMADWLTLGATVGKARETQARMASLVDRSITGSAAERIHRVREAISMMAAHPERTRWCAPEALIALLEAREGKGVAIPKALATYRGNLDGTTLAEVQQLAARAGVDLKMVKRAGATELPVPSIVHWKVGHYATLAERRGNEYRVVDRARMGEYWIPVETVLAETSGYFLVDDGLHLEGLASRGNAASAGPDANHWTPVTGAEGAAVVGTGPICDDGGAPPGPPCGPGCGGGRGMAIYRLLPVSASLLLHDTPVGYAPARGPSVPFALMYHQREVFQPQVFTFANVGPKWTLNWLRFVKEEPTDVLGVTPTHLWVPLASGGREVFTSADGTTRHWNSGAVLVLVSSNPLMYERQLPDGTREVFSQSDGAPSGSRRVFLTGIIDPQGLSLTFTWDQQFRLVAVTDALGQVSTIEYEDGSNPLRLTSITDPFDRQATLTYNGAGQLQSITDVIGLTSRFEYGPEDFVTTLRTPYGATTFRHEPRELNTLYTKRFVEATDPIGGTERIEFQYETPTMAATETSVPAGFTNWNKSLNRFNTFYWSKLAWAQAPASLTSAQVTHWLEAPEFSGWQIYSQPIPHSEKPALDARVWYAYAGQGTNTEDFVGATNLAGRVGRVIEGGASQIYETTYNIQRMPLSQTDPLGRETTYTYDTNGTDLLQVRQTNGGGSDFLAAYADYAGHDLPETMTDAGGGVTTVTYNSAGQVLTRTNPLSETTTFAYNTGGQLTSLTGPVSGVVTTMTYDGYGRVRTVTEPGGYTTTTDYDALDRPTRVSFPDGTYDEMTYTRLDLATRRDRAGRVTRYFYDPLGRLTGTRDPLGRAVTQNWCACGALEALIDAKGNATRWVRDVQGRTLREVRADSSETAYSYGTSSGRLLQVEDAKSQVTTYVYALDDALTGVSFSNATVTTPSVSFTYESAYPRRATMVDGTGTTSYTYVPSGTPGAGQVAAVDGPLTDDTIEYEYDTLGRMDSREIDGIGLTYSFDGLGRVTTEVNALGTFTYTYDGVTPRLATVTYPNGQTSAYSYFGSTADPRLQTIHHKYPGGATLSKYDYTYDAVGNILTWLQQADSDPAVEWSYGYDAADQLTAALKVSTGQSPTVLATHRYGYDPAGNRTYEQIDQAITLATYDNMNRLTTQVPGGALAVAGMLNEAATVTIQGVPGTVTSGGVFSGTVPVTGGTNRFTIVATDATGNTTTKQWDVDVAGASLSFAYDANGSLLSDGARTFEWDALRQITRVVHGGNAREFEYDGHQRRVRAVATEGGVVQGESRTIWCDSVPCETRAADGTSVLRRRFLDGEEVSGQAQFLARDHLGSPWAVLGATGTLLSQYVFDSWGERSLETGADTTSVGFAGQDWDAPSGLSLTWYRAYSPVLGRWISQDPLGVAGGINLYQYAANSPTVYGDPLGLVAMNITEPTIRELPKAKIGGCGKLSGRVHLTFSCECIEGEWKAKLAINMFGEIQVANDTWLTSKASIIRHERRHWYEKVAEAYAAKAAGEAIERDSFPSERKCIVAADRWKLEWEQRIQVAGGHSAWDSFKNGLLCN